MKIKLVLMYIAIIPIVTSCYKSEDQENTIRESSWKAGSYRPDNYETCDFMIDIYSWDEIYYRKPPILGSNNKAYESDRNTLEAILKQKFPKNGVLVINKHRNCKLSNSQIKKWAAEMGILNIIIQPLSQKHEGFKDSEHLKSLI